MNSTQTLLSRLSKVLFWLFLLICIGTLGLIAIFSYYSKDLPSTEDLKKYQPKIIKVLATSAIREAGNGLDFISETKKLTGIETTIISGDKEAELIYLGNRLAVEMSDEAHLIMDIGGGSTEFIIANSKTG